ncbi:MAG: preprotein translocase subunit SecE [Collinsella sp.]|jgi:preprotein translocase subunit SecE|nr:preprotein translocase subunit SecE [Collinsella sp.]
MAKKERQKRSARKARAAERAELEATRAASQAGSKEQAKKADATVAKASTKKAESKPVKKQGRIRSYFSAVKAEMHRVVWPDKNELRSYSIAVIMMLIVFGVCVWLVDTGFVALLVGFTGLRG